MTFYDDFDSDPDSRDIKTLLFLYWLKTNIVTWLIMTGV